MGIKYGCIGEHLKHSFSKEIHNALADYEYEILEIAREDLRGFALERDFLAINVTIPYKELIMPYMYKIDDHAKAIGSVNTVVNRDGKLFGYNTDFYGMKKLLSHAGISLSGKKVAILGTGGTAKTATAVAKSEGALGILLVSRTGREDAFTYEELYEEFSDAEIIINTTPVGMFPNIFDAPIDLSKFDKLEGVIDAVYNPLRTSLIMEAKKRGITAEGGLYMLVSQAVKASEIFTDAEYGESRLDEVYKKILSEKENIVLIGMPASGKSTVGRLLANRLKRPLYDTDALIEKKTGMPVREIFEKYGEEHFRMLESEAIKGLSPISGSIISTGGGAILKEENLTALKKNGRIYFIDRPIEALIPTDSRPLAASKENIERLYAERYSIYLHAADKTISAIENAETVAEKIEGDFIR